MRSTRRRSFARRSSVAAERTRELMERYPEANVCVAPHSLHAASQEMIRAAAEFAREHDCMMHVHVAEAPYEGEQTLERFGATPIELLDGWARSTSEPSRFTRSTSPKRRRS